MPKAVFWFIAGLIGVAAIVVVAAVFSLLMAITGIAGTLWYIPAYLIYLGICFALGWQWSGITNRLYCQKYHRSHK